MFKNFWYAVEEARSVQHTPRRVKVLAQDLVLYRKPSGEIVALSDLCPHRGGSLADGTVDDGCVRCPYHGWTFGADGHCREIPANGPNIAIPKKAQIDAYPIAERYGFVWVFLGDLPEAERPAIPPLPEFGQPGWRAIWGEFTWKAHYTRVCENGVDIAHTPFVHQNSFGDRAHPEIEAFEVYEDEMSARMAVTLSPPMPQGLWKYLRRKNSRVTAGLEIYMPNVTRLHLKFSLGEQILLDSNIPIDEHTTLTRFVHLRNFFTGAWADRDARRRIMKIFREDQQIVEAQRPELLPYDLGAELHLRSDAMAIAYRKLRRNYFARGWGIDSDRIRHEITGKTAVVIPSPARRENAELAKAWVVPEVPLIDLRRPPKAN